tara:strand:+ start:654 stop:1094 length:441 start_codon:yes stop_codon:yes gene_type:complete
MKAVDRLVRISCFYNKVKFADFHNMFCNPRNTDARAIVYHILNTELEFSIYDISELFNKEKAYIEKLLKHHNSEYNVINHYTRQYENTLTQFKQWNKTDLDLAYSIIKTKHDQDLDTRYEQILNENNRLTWENDILKIKLNKKSYV